MLIGRQPTSPEPTGSRVGALGAAAAWTRVATIALWVVILAGPVLALLALTSENNGAPTRDAGTEPRVARSSTGPEEFAVRYVHAWLTAEADEPGSGDLLGRFLPDPPSSSTGTVTAARVTDLQPAMAREVRPGYWSITVSGLVHPADNETDDDAKTDAAQDDDANGVGTARVRYWRVGVLAQGDATAGGTGDNSHQSSAVRGYIATSLPAMVAAPTRTAAPQDAYVTAVDGAPGAVGGSVAEFIELYLTGQELDRYLAPGIRITAPRPAAYLDAEVVRLAAAGTGVDLTANATPADGDQIRVLATVQPYTDAGAAPLLQYALKLTGRAGRWEVAGLDPAPLLQKPNSDPTGGPR